jgi:hypothetical protein
MKTNTRSLILAFLAKQKILLHGKRLDMAPYSESEFENAPLLSV